MSSSCSYTQAKRKIARFCCTEFGNATIEGVIWAPFFFFLLLTAGQLGMIFYGQAMTLDVAQDATRAYSVGELSNAKEVVAFVQARMANVSSNVSVSSNISEGLITTIISLPAGDFGGPLRHFADLAELQVQVVAQQSKEI